MDRLSQEVLLVIMGHVASSTDLKSLRIVNKAMSILATEALFHILYIRCQKGSLAKLIAISKHPIISQLVTIITYDADTDFWEYQSSSHISGDPRWSASVEPRLGHYQIHGMLMDEASRLAYAMAGLTNVREIRFTKLTNLRLDRSKSRVAYPRNPAAITDLPEDLCGYGVRSFVALMRATSIAARPIHAVEISDRLYGLHYNILNLKGVDMYHVVSVLTDLTSVSLYLNTNEGERGSEDALQAGQLSNLLMTSTRLQELSLGFDQRPSDRVRLVRMLGSGRWKRLRKLKIMAIDFHLWELTDFLRRHRNISHIGLNNCRLHSGTLQQLFTLLRDGLSSLKELGLDGALGDSVMEYDFFQGSENHRAAVDFVLNGGDYPNFSMAVPKEN